MCAASGLSRRAVSDWQCVPVRPGGLIKSGSACRTDEPNWGRRIRCEHAAVRHPLFNPALQPVLGKACWTPDRRVAILAATQP